MILQNPTSVRLLWVNDIRIRFVKRDSELTLGIDSNAEAMAHAYSSLARLIDLKL